MSSDVSTPTARLTVAQALNGAPRSRFHHRTAVISGVGFFTDAYDLFVIATVATLVKAQWHLSTTATSWVTGAAILGAFVGAITFGRLADHLGRKSIYVTVAVIMIVGALASAFAPDLIALVLSRFVLGLGIGGDYPVSAVLMSEYANQRDRGRLVSLVFSMQALGLIVGPVVAIALLGSGAGHTLTWRLLLGLGAVPVLAVLYLRTKMPESPRFVARVRGQAAAAATELATYSDGVAVATATDSTAAPAGWRALVADRRLMRFVIGTAGSWFLFDYAYYGNTLSLPSILTKISATATLDDKLAWSLGIFVLFALPGYLLAISKMDRVGHRRLQLLGFGALAVGFAVLGAVPALTTDLAPFLLIFGATYFFVEFGPNTTTFVLPSEVFPDRLRTTGHGLAAGIGKLGAFIGVFVVPDLQTAIGLRGMLAVAAAFSALGVGATLLLPETSRASLEDLAAGPPATGRARSESPVPAVA